MTTPNPAISVTGYFKGLGQHAATGWNRFWFEPSDVFNLCVLRIATAGLALIWLASFTADLSRLFATDGVLAEPILRGVLLSDLGYKLSYLRLFPHPTAVLVVHAAGGLILLAMCLGFRTRTAAVLSFVVVLTYVHRASVMMGPAESALTMMMAYLCLAPIGAFLSVDAQRRAASVGVPPATWSATLAGRLIQVHLVLLHLTIGLSALAGRTWWFGDAMWWLSAQPDSRIVDLTFLRGQPVLINVWTHLMIAYFLAYPLLVWNRWWRPLVLCASVVAWVSLAIATANVGFAVTMIVANLAFVPSELWRTVLRRPLASV